MKKSRLLCAVYAFALLIMANTALAAVVNPISGLDIGGTLYDVTFHTNSGDSFNVLWDANDDGAFGGGGSVFSAAPTFWDDQAGAEAAADAIIAYLGLVDETFNFTDAFLVPYNTDNFLGSDKIQSGPEQIISVTDSFSGTFLDSRDSNYSLLDHDGTAYWSVPYASFAISSVPVPAAAWLFGSGLLSLFGMARRKKAT